MDAINIISLSKIFKTSFLRRTFTAIKNISFSVEKGSIFGFLGPNGAGKTTTIKIIVGLLKASSGMVKIFGRDSRDINSHRNTGYLPESPYFYNYLTGKELLNYYSHLVDLKGSTRNARIEELLKLVGIWEARNLPLRSYSKGMLQRIGIAQALLNNPDLLILDEPMSGLDPIGRKEMRDLILKLKADGKTIFFSTHILADVELICDRVAIIHQGNLLSVGVLGELKPLNQELYEIAIEGGNEKILNESSTLASEVKQTGDVIILRVNSKKNIDIIWEMVKRNGGDIIMVAPVRKSLEEIFIEELGGAKTSDLSLTSEK
jgi:ABC-2 type transport system ATP-binding protein